MRVLLGAVAATLVAAASASAFGDATGSPASGARAAAVFAPVVDATPSLTGTAEAGRTLTASPGTWRRDTDDLDLRWLLCDDDGEQCAPLDGASGATLQLADAHVGRRLRVRVTATNAGGARTAVSAASARVQARRAPQVVAPPAVGGQATVGERLTATPGTWTDTPDTVTYQWLRCAPACAELPGETSPRYRLDGADAGATLRVDVTAANAGGATTVTSAPSAVVVRRSYTQLLCANPRTGQGLVADGALPDGMWQEVDRAHFGYLLNRAQCGGTMTTDRGIPIRPWSRSWGTHWAMTGTILKYRAPSAVTFQGATLYRRLNFAGALQMGASITGGADGWLYGGPRWELCETAAGCSGANAAPASPWTSPVAVGTSPQVNGFDVMVKCAAPSDAWTCGADLDHGYTLYGASVALHDPADPRATAAPAGTLATDATLDGEETLHLALHDGESGVYRVRIELDGDEVATRIPDAHGGRCADADPGHGDAYEFAHTLPCPPAVATTLTIDTTGWPAGEHRLKVRVEDAGGNGVTVLSRSVVVARP